MPTYDVFFNIYNIVQEKKYRKMFSSYQEIYMNVSDEEFLINKK